MLTLFHAPWSRSSRLVWLLEEIGVGYEICYCDIPRMDGSGARDPRNPHPDGKVPALLHDDVLVTESAAVALYLTDLFPEAGLGAQWVAGRGDPALARAARDLVVKIAATVPERLRPVVLEPAVASAPVWKPNEIETLDMSRVRAWIHAGRKLRLHYADEQGNETLRVIWPFLIGYRETTRLLVGWCEMRGDFRTFRTDRVVEADFLEDRYPGRPAVLRGKWFARMEAERAAWEAAGRPMPPGGC